MHFLVSVFLILSIAYASYASDNIYTQNEFQEELFSPLKNPYSKKILSYTGLTCASLILTREYTIIPIQEFITEKNFLGDSSPVGDAMGRMIPNIAYIVYQLNFGELAQKNRRALYMTKVSLFAGGTTFFLKRMINQRRPSSTDRNSFPSGHTTTAFAFASVISHEHPTYSKYAYGLASFVGFSRLNDNVHYIHDVIMGAGIGIAFAVALKNNSPLSISPLSQGAQMNYTISY